MTYLLYDMIYICSLQLGSHTVAAVQYTFTHKQYTERHKTINTENNTKILEECGPCPIVAGFKPGICLTTEEKARQNLSQGSWRVTVYILHIIKTHIHYKTHTHTHPRITKPTHTHTHTHPRITKPTYTHTHTLQNPHIHTPTYLLTPWSRVLLEKLTSKLWS